MRILISCLLIASLYSCNEESADKPSSSDTKNNVEVELEDTVSTMPQDSDTVLVVSESNKHLDDYLKTKFHFSGGKVQISKDGEDLHAGLYKWVDGFLHIELNNYPYELDYAVKRRGEIDYQLSDNHGLILQTTFENPNL